jgi:ABC-type Zn uptake system ZnuABC Zn-binding protein ZnuA
MDLLKVNKADLLIYNGLTLDEVFVDKMIRNRKNKDLARLNVGDVLDKKYPDLIERGPKIKHKHADGTWHEHGAEDPHFWLGPKRMKTVTEIIAAKLGEIDSANSAKYSERAAQFAKKLDDLQAHGDAAFKDKTNRKFITQHESLKYFAKDFGLTNVDAIQIQPGMDADAKKIADLIDICKKQDVRVIAVEPQYSAAQAETIRDALKKKNVDVTIVTIDPLETAPVSGKHGKYNPDPDYYFTKMRENIDSLAKALP